VPDARADKLAGSVEYLNPPDIKKSPVFSRAAIVRTERLIFSSGLYGDGPDAEARIRDIFGKLRTLTEQSGGNFDHLVKATYYVQDAESSKLLNEIRPEFYDPERPPAASKAIVQGVGRNDRKITVDMIAAAK
jgi:enamine deaminase RidA (YjgF/YER057c/UK114 family)